MVCLTVALSPSNCAHEPRGQVGGSSAAAGRAGGRNAGSWVLLHRGNRNVTGNSKIWQKSGVEQKMNVIEKSGGSWGQNWGHEGSGGRCFVCFRLVMTTVYSNLTDFSGQMKVRISNFKFWIQYQRNLFAGEGTMNIRD
jgi:hypothetical protein